MMFLVLGTPFKAMAKAWLFSQKCNPESGWHNLRLVIASIFSQNVVLKVRMSFCDIHDKNSVNQVFWRKTTVFSLPATEIHYLLIFWFPHLYKLLQPFL